MKKHLGKVSPSSLSLSLSLSLLQIEKMVAGAAANTAKKSFWSIWYKHEIIPIYVTVGAACGLAGYYLTRLARGPEVVWDRTNNPYPWQNIDQDTQVKFMTVNQKFAKT